MNEEDLRDCFAMFAMLGLINHTKNTPYDFKFDEIAEGSWSLADAMMEARKPKEEAGIASVKRVRKVK
jgi:hypothetical protein